MRRASRALLAAFALTIGVLLFVPAHGAARAINLPVEKENWYAIRWENNLIGYSRFGVEQTVELGGDQFYVINSDSRIKLGPGEKNDVVFTARLLLNRATLMPSLFICAQKQGQTELRVECLFTPRLVAQKNTQGGQEVSTTVDVERSPYLVFNNVWGRVDTLLEHYVALLAAWRANGEKEEVTVYEPVLRGTETLRIQATGRENVQVLGRDFAARVVQISDGRGQAIVKAWLSDQGRLLRLDDLHGNFTFTLSDARVEGMVKKAVGVNLYKHRVEFSNVYFPNATDLRNFKARLDLKVNGKADMARDIRGYRQTFDGSVNEGLIKGTVDVQSNDVTVKNSTLYPRRAAYEGELARYVLPEPGIEARDDEMISKAEEVAWRSRTSWEAAKKINTWVHEKVADGYSMPSGRFVLQHMAGNSESKALLVVTLLRAVNVPARKVSGILFSNGNFVPHSWVEVYVGDDGWIALDPTTGEAGTLGATHVALGDGSDLSSMDIQVLSFAPRPPDRVPFFNKELAWPVGEQRVYSVIHGGKEIGREVAHVKGLTNIDGHDAYEMEFISEANVDKKPAATPSPSASPGASATASPTPAPTPQMKVTASSRLITRPDVLPLRFTVESTVDGQKTVNTYDFGRDVVRENVKVGEETRVQETPLSEGAYVFDPRFLSMYALIVGQLPNPSLGTRATIYVYNPTTHNTQELALQIRQEEKVGVGGEERDTWRCESTDGVSFYIDKKSGQVVRVENPRQDMVLQLIESATKI